jgi:hypothetical protein
MREIRAELGLSVPGAHPDNDHFDKVRACIEKNPVTAG